MPIYEYLCESCRHQFEVRQKFSDDPISACVRCGNAVKKIISAPAIMFKGSGWYVTDYSDKLKAPEQSTTTNEAEAKPSTSPETKSPAATPTGENTASTAAASPVPSGSGNESGSKSASPAPSSATPPSSS